VWAWADRKELVRVNHSGFVANTWSVDISRDGTRLASGSGDGSARICAIATGKQLHRLKHQRTVRAVAFSPDGTRLLTGSEDTTARIWNASTGAQLLDVKLDDEGYYVSSVAFAPDGTWFVTGSLHNVCGWDAATGGRYAKLALDESVNAVAISPDGARVAAVGVNGRVRVWQVLGGTS
jgi:WD40 repeat protein